MPVAGEQQVSQRRVASAASWVIEVLNNNGVTKAVNASEVVDATFTMLVKITAKFA